MNVQELAQLFGHPERKHAIYPIVHGRIVTDIAGKLAAQGFAGGVGNVPYGAGYPDDPEEWRSTERGFRAFTDKGLHTWIYDEKGYPSGSAGGAVIDEHPEFTAKGLVCYEYWRTLTGPCRYRSDVPGDRLFKAMLLPLGGGEAIDVTHFLNDRNVLHMDIPAGDFHLFLMSERRMFDGTHAAESYSEPRDCTNLCDADATRAFIRVTHAKYHERLGDEFGKGVRAFFTDEPSLIAWNIRQNVYPVVPWHASFPAEFAARYGYPVELAVVAVVTRRGHEVAKRRCDFWDFVADQVADNYFGVIQDWCRAHGIASSGHLLWEENVQSHIVCYGSFYRCAKRLDWPGIDQLESEPDRLMSHGAIPIARLLASFADVYGGAESFTEFSDHNSRMANRQIGMNWIKASVNWHFAMGINNLTSYYNFAAFSDDELRDLNAYAARIGTLIRAGKRLSRTAVLYPEAAMWTEYTPSIGRGGQDSSPAMCRIQEVFAKVSWELLDRQIDFDYIDEALLNAGEIVDGKLHYNGRAYECVIFPACGTLSEVSVNRIEALVQAGVGVVFAGTLPDVSRENGPGNDFPRRLSPLVGTRHCALVPYGSEYLLPSSRQFPLPRPVRIVPKGLASVLTGAEGKASFHDGEVISRDILMHTRSTGDALVVFLCNMGGKTYEGTILAENGRAATIARPGDGSLEPAAAACAAGLLSFDLKLRAYEAAFCLIEV
ncbi:MAG: hypothetical protein RBU25_00150 [Lentisphaeria bacterium]|jgi:hypothetical protein|nr:hypothetical protein [Lentisphaeria bacterium]